MHSHRKVLCTPEKNTREAVLRRKRTITGSTFRVSVATSADDGDHLHTDAALPPPSALKSNLREAQRGASVRLARHRSAQGTQSADGTVPRMSSVSASIDACGAPEQRTHVGRRRCSQEDPDVTIYSIAGSPLPDSPDAMFFGKSNSQPLLTPRIRISLHISLRLPKMNRTVQYVVHFACACRGQLVELAVGLKCDFVEAAK